MNQGVMHLYADDVEDAARRLDQLIGNRLLTGAEIISSIVQFQIIRRHSGYGDYEVVALVNTEVQE